MCEKVSVYAKIHSCVCEKECVFVSRCIHAFVCGQMHPCMCVRKTLSVCTRKSVSISIVLCVFVDAVSFLLRNKMVDLV